MAQRASTQLERRAAPSLRRVINASGVILQTNLGRAPLSKAAHRAMLDVAGAYSNLELDLESGERGSRHEHVRGLIRRTTGAEDGIVVNNNAAALLMVLQVFAAGRQVIVSRGQAVEIGGGFRIPDVLRQSGAQLVEVGTTNRTYARDYEAALTETSAAILRVHTSNFRVVGFTASPALAELAELSRKAGILLIDDLGSGCLVTTERFGIAHEPTVQESVAAGADLVLFSGDKLLGGPQAGIIAGRGELIEALRRHPLARALRVDKLTIAALNATLSSYAEGRELDDIPVWQMVGANLASLKRRAARWARAVRPVATVAPSMTMIGGGSAPGEGLRTWCTAVTLPGLSTVAHHLRTGEPAVVGRIEDGRLLLDPRTVSSEDDEFVSTALRAAIASGQ
jgi:L-seryl-tRNA(Ser) seleniumtransferase